MWQQPRADALCDGSPSAVEHAGQTRRRASVSDIGPPSRVSVTAPDRERMPRDREATTSRPRLGPSLMTVESGIWHRCVAESDHLCFVAVAPDGRVRAVNLAFATRLGYSPPALAERDIWSLLTDADAAHLRLCVLHGWMPTPEPLLLTFVGADGTHFTLRCLAEVDPDGLVLIGEPPGRGGA